MNKAPPDYFIYKIQGKTRLDKDVLTLKYKGYVKKKIDIYFYCVYRNSITGTVEKYEIKLQFIQKKVKF